jgi:hypothetical protein
VFGAAVVGFVFCLVGARPDAQTANPCASPANKIIAENCKPGNPSTDWDINGTGDQSIQGFSTDISYNLGQTAQFKVKTDSPKWRVDIYRTGYYNGNGARLITTVRPTATLPQRQPECAIEWDTRLYDCGTWAVSAEWAIPADAVSGVYIARIIREDPDNNWRMDGSRVPGGRPATGPGAYGSMGKLRNPLKEPRANHIVFIVRDDSSRADVVMQTSDPTWTAYNPYGLGNVYNGSNVTGDGSGRPLRANKASWNRPLGQNGTVNQYLNAEYTLVRWLERNGYDTTYFSGLDSDRHGQLLKNHKLFISVGHDEYWSLKQRTNVEAARDAGVNLAFMSGNEVFWHIRYEDSIDGSKTPLRTLIVYKETHSNQDEIGRTIPTTKIDPKKDEWTGTWRDANKANPEGGKPENALTGTIFTVNANRQDPIVLSAKFAKLRFWRNTDVAKLTGTEQIVTANGILGHEWDEDLDNGFRPKGLIRLSETKVNGVPYPVDHGSVYDQGTATHSLTLYRAPSGALVFGGGTVQYSWGLDNHHSAPTSRGAQANPYSNRVGFDPYGPSKIIQQATVNLFADMGVQPKNLQNDLMPATPSMDKSAPLSNIATPAENALVSGAVIRVSGTASDTGGGVVAGVEVSLDGGATWHPATGTDRWTFEGQVPAGTGTMTIMSRASDDSVNIETPKAGTTVRYNYQVPKTSASANPR